MFLTRGFTLVGNRLSLCLIHTFGIACQHFGNCLGKLFPRFGVYFSTFLVKIGIILLKNPIWEISPRAENDPIKLDFFLFHGKFFSQSFYCGNFSKLFIDHDKLPRELPIIFVLDVYLLNLPKTASKLGFLTVS